MNLLTHLLIYDLTASALILWLACLQSAHLASPYAAGGTWESAREDS